MRNNLRNMDKSDSSLVHLKSSDEDVDTNAKDLELMHQQGMMSDCDKNYSDMFRNNENDLDDVGDSGDDLDDDDMLMDMENKHMGRNSDGSGGNGGYSGRQYGGSNASSSGMFGEDDKRKRRAIANSNERRRMQSINAGFQTLKSLIPHSSGEKLSKACILQRSADYMRYLSGEREKLNKQLQIAQKQIESNGLLAAYQSQISSELGQSHSQASLSMSSSSSSASKSSSTKINKQPTISNLNSISASSNNCLASATAKSQTTILQPVSLNETISSPKTEATSAATTTSSSEPTTTSQQISSPAKPTANLGPNAFLTAVASNTKSTPGPLVLGKKTINSTTTSTVSLSSGSDQSSTKINTLMTSSGVSPTVKSTASSPVTGASPLSAAKTSKVTIPASTSMKLNELISNASSANSTSATLTTNTNATSSNETNTVSLIQPLPNNRQLTDTTNIKQHNQMTLLQPSSAGSLNSILINTSGANLINVANSMLINNALSSSGEGLIIQTPLLSSPMTSQTDELKSHHLKSSNKKKATSNEIGHSTNDSITKMEAGHLDILKLIDLKASSGLDLQADAVKSLINASTCLSVPIITSSLQLPNNSESDVVDDEEASKRVGVDMVTSDLKPDNEQNDMEENETDSYEAMDDEKDLKMEASSRSYQSEASSSSSTAAKSLLCLQPQQHARLIKSSRSNSIDQLIAAAAATQTCSSTATSPSPSPSSPSPSTSSVASSNASTLVSTPLLSSGSNAIIHTMLSSQVNSASANTGNTNNAPSPSSSCSSTTSSISTSSGKHQRNGGSLLMANDRNFSRKGLNTIVEAIIHVEGKNLLEELVESASPTSSTSSTHSSSSTSSLTGQNLTSTSSNTSATRNEDAATTSSLRNQSQQQQQKPPKKRKYTSEEMVNHVTGEIISQLPAAQAQQANYHYISDYYNNANSSLINNSSTSPKTKTAPSTQMCFIDINQLSTLLLNTNNNANQNTNPIVLNLSNDNISLMMPSSGTPLPSQAISIPLVASSDAVDKSSLSGSRRSTSDNNNNSNNHTNNNNNNNKNPGNNSGSNQSTSSNKPVSSSSAATNLQLMPT